VDSAEEFNPAEHVTNIYVHWERSKFFADLKDDPDIQWEYTLTHKAMAEAKKQAKQEIDGNTGSGSEGGGGDVTGGDDQTE